MDDPLPLDSSWLKAHPLPDHQDNVDKNGRGRVLVIGGCRRVPGGMLLTAEAAFRAGAGKVTIATIASAALPVGIALPGCAVVALPECDGEIDPSCIDQLIAEFANHDAIVFGPAMIDAGKVRKLLEPLLSALPDDMFLLLDAFALRVLPDFSDSVSTRGHNIMLTPHAGELAALLGIETRAVANDPLAALKKAVATFQTTVMVKGATSHVMAGNTCLSFPGGGHGLAISGSGDVLAGLIAGLAAQGLSPLHAAAWGIWLHGEAGRRLAETMGPIGYLANELLPLIPSLMRGVR